MAENREARSGAGEVHGPTRPRIHNLKMLRAISAVVLERSGNEQLAESVRQWLSAEKEASTEASGEGLDARIRYEDYKTALDLLREAHRRMGLTAFPNLAYRISQFLKTAPEV